MLFGVKNIRNELFLNPPVAFEVAKRNHINFDKKNIMSTPPFTTYCDVNIEWFSRFYEIMDLYNDLLIRLIYFDHYLKNTGKRDITYHDDIKLLLKKYIGSSGNSEYNMHKILDTLKTNTLSADNTQLIELLNTNIEHKNPADYHIDMEQLSKDIVEKYMKTVIRYQKKSFKAYNNIKLSSTKIDEMIEKAVNLDEHGETVRDLRENLGDIITYIKALEGILVGINIIYKIFVKSSQLKNIIICSDSHQIKIINGILNGCVKNLKKKKELTGSKKIEQVTGESCVLLYKITKDNLLDFNI